MLKILWKMEEIAPGEQFLPLSTIFCYLLLDFYVKTGIRFSLRDKRLFEITEVEITRVDCIGTPKINNFSICFLNVKFIIFRCSKIWTYYNLIIMCLNIGTPKHIIFPFGTKGKLIVLGVPILRHFGVCTLKKKLGSNISG